MLMHPPIPEFVGMSTVSLSEIGVWEPTGKSQTVYFTFYSTMDDDRADAALLAYERGDFMTYREAMNAIRARIAQRYGM